MLVVRAWPDHPPHGHARIEDGWPRVAVDGYDYRGLADLGEDVISLDWDVAVSREDLHAFAGHARAQPGRVLYAPYRAYGQAPGWVWAAKVYLADGMQMRYVDERDQFCHLFGFGMIYLPAPLIKGFIAANPGKVMDDISFSGWHYRNVARETPIDWPVRPVHLHYDIPADGRVRTRREGRSWPER
jgi:hypothetical protein